MGFDVVVGFHVVMGFHVMMGFHVVMGLHVVMGFHIVTSCNPGKEGQCKNTSVQCRMAETQLVCIHSIRKSFAQLDNCSVNQQVTCLFSQKVQLETFQVKGLESGMLGCSG